MFKEHDTGNLQTKLPTEILKSTNDEDKEIACLEGDHELTEK